MPGLFKEPKPPSSPIISYMTMRKVIGLFGLSLVPVHILGTFILDSDDYFKVSVSAYYYSHMRNVLVGVLCCISLFLISYHGYDWKDSLASKIAGIFATGIAFFPTSETNDKTDIISTLHYINSGIFFVTLSYMSIFLFTKTKGAFTKTKETRNKVYIICGVTMLIAVACIPLDKIPKVHEKISFLKPVLILETMALICFGFSWLVKGQFVLKD